MQRVSTSATLFLKFFIPTFWIVFFGATAVALFLSPQASFGRIPMGAMRIGIVVFFLLGTFALYWALMRLKRVELDPDFVYVTNYFKTFRYPYHNVEKMEESDYLFFRSMHIYFKEQGTFGKKVTFVVSQKRLDDFLKEYPEVAEQLLGEE